jgi:TFIIH basal transcription factor complex TTD-A subunit
MVKALKGVFIKCDPAMKQFLLYLDEANVLQKRFIIQNIDDTHAFVIAKLVDVLQE